MVHPALSRHLVPRRQMRQDGVPNNHLKNRTGVNYGQAAHVVDSWCEGSTPFHSVPPAILIWGSMSRSMSERIKSDLTCGSLLMAIWKRKPPKGLMIHSDRGSQYASNKFQDLLEKQGFVCSMSRKGNCWDSAPAESFFHTLKTELVNHYQFKARGCGRSVARSIFHKKTLSRNRLSV